ncbi:Secondary metabolism regulator LAE1 [Metarhizium anisopliae]|nr:Secondary metabolism regulator LAE1 [Metarhizium anisopliae]
MDVQTDSRGEALSPYTHTFQASHQAGPARMVEDVERRFGNRWYGKDGHGLSRTKYIFPIDEEERARLDVFHKIFLMARGDVLYSSPLDTTKKLRILDLGTGTGHWSIDMAE